MHLPETTRANYMNQHAMLTTLLQGIILSNQIVCIKAGHVIMLSGLGRV